MTPSIRMFIFYLKKVNITSETEKIADSMIILISQNLKKNINFKLKLKHLNLT